MAQTITDYSTLLADAVDALQELNQLKKQADHLKSEETRLEKSLETEKKAAADAVNSTIKKRIQEINNSYDQEINKSQDRLKKVRAKREKAKSQGIKDRIQEETADLCEHNRELRVSIKTLFQQKHVPAFCNSDWYYSLYFTRGFKEAMVLLVTLSVCFFVIPWGIYEAIPKREPFYLAGIYFAAIIIFGGSYILIGNKTKGLYPEALKEGRSIRNVIMSNQKKIRVIAGSIRKDKDEDIYNLERFDDEIAQLEQDLAQIARKKKEALNTFENVTKTIISDEIMDSYKDRINQLEEDLMEIESQSKYTEIMVKEKIMFITDNYEVYTGKEFLHVEKLQQLGELISSGQAANISEAIDIYRSAKK